MKELLLTDSEAKALIKIIKAIANKHNRTLTNRSSGTINLVGKHDTRFILNYFYSTTSKVFHLRETQHNYTLLRIINSIRTQTARKFGAIELTSSLKKSIIKKGMKQLITKPIHYLMKIFLTLMTSWICLIICLTIPM